jgi:hypothetical protein
MMMMMMMMIILSCYTSPRDPKVLASAREAYAPPLNKGDLQLLVFQTRNALYAMKRRSNQNRKHRATRGNMPHNHGVARCHQEHHSEKQYGNSNK